MYISHCADCSLYICNASNLFIEKGVVISPNGTSPDCTVYTVECDPGYSTSNPSDAMYCDRTGLWTNKPSCKGKMSAYVWGKW